MLAIENVAPLAGMAEFAPPLLSTIGAERMAASVSVHGVPGGFGCVTAGVTFLEDDVVTPSVAHNVVLAFQRLKLQPDFDRSF